MRETPAQVGTSAPIRNTSANNTNSATDPLTPITLTLDLDDRDLAREVAGALQELVIPTPDALTLFENGPARWRIDSYYTEAVDADELHQTLTNTVGQSLPKFSQAIVPDENWVAISQAALPAVTAGRFTVHGSHDCNRIARGPNSILIDAAEAFGTAHHPTTLGCLRALDLLTRRPPQRRRAFKNCLDLGCGSGVLAIALARALPSATFLASDMDPQSIVVAARNMRINGAHARIETVAAAGTAHPRIRNRAPFDLVVANILAGPLIHLAGDIRRATKLGGTLVLSGLLVGQAPAVIATYLAYGFRLVQHDCIEEWSTLTLQRRN